MVIKKNKTIYALGTQARKNWKSTRQSCFNTVSGQNFKNFQYVWQFSVMKKYIIAHLWYTFAFFQSVFKRSATVFLWTNQFLLPKQRFLSFFLFLKILDFLVLFNGPYCTVHVTNQRKSECSSDYLRSVTIKHL